MNSETNRSKKCPEENDIPIEIFSESMKEYLQKLDNAAKGCYELDNYDMQVLAVALDQYAQTGLTTNF